MFDLKLIAAQIDGPVLAALDAVPNSEPIERVAEVAGVSMRQLRASMYRLGLRVPGKTWPKLEC